MSHSPLAMKSNGALEYNSELGRLISFHPLSKGYQWQWMVMSLMFIVTMSALIIFAADQPSPLTHLIMPAIFSPLMAYAIWVWGDWIAVYENGIMDHTRTRTIGVKWAEIAKADFKKLQEIVQYRNTDLRGKGALKIRLCIRTTSKKKIKVHEGYDRVSVFWDGVAAQLRLHGQDIQDFEATETVEDVMKGRTF